MKDPEEFLKLNDQLLATTKEVSDAIAVSPKRNSKDELIQKLINVCQEGDIKLPHSNTKLKRMNKQQLMKLLAECTADAVRNQMCQQVGAKPGARDSIIALGALRMVHDMIAMTAERGLNVVLPRYGYEIAGFSSALKDPTVREATDACLAEIAADSDLMSYVESPYSRLAIAWSGALLTSVRKYQPESKETNAPELGPQTSHFAYPVQRRAGGGPPAGQKHGVFRPPAPVVHKV